MDSTAPVGERASGVGMNLQTFKAATMAEALSQVKATIGPDALILHTRTYQQRYWLGLRRKEIVEITAGKGSNLRPRQSRPQPQQQVQPKPVVSTPSVPQLGTRNSELGTRNSLTVTTAESCTGGLLSKMLTDVSGSSDYFKQGWITYSNDAKRERLGVSENILNVHGAVSEPVAIAMASHARRLAKSDFALSVSGIAGPNGGTPLKPVGTVCIALAYTTPGTPRSSALLNRIWTICLPVRFGNACAIRATAPLIVGAAKLVPDQMY